MNGINYICNLPDDVIREIFDYIPRCKLVPINTMYFNVYHRMIKNNIKMYESYVRHMIKRDNFFIFDRLVRENVNIWIENKKYRYQNKVFSNYIYFVLHFCIENNSQLCRNILMEELSKRDLCRNLHKKNVIRYIKWNG
jgi:hypothetical protein